MNNTLNIAFTKHEWYFIFMFVFLFFQAILERLSVYFSLSDEFFSLFGLYIFLFRSKYKYVFSNYPLVKTIFKAVYVIISLGIISSFKYKIQHSLIVNLLDLFSFVKFFILFFFSLWLLEKCRISKTLHAIYVLVCIYLIVGFIFMLISQFVDIGMVFEKRYGLNAYMFINPNPGDYSSILIISLVIVHVYSYFSGRACLFLKLIACILIVSTFRGKALGFILTYFFLLYYVYKLGNLNVKSLLFLALMAIAGGYMQIRYYFVDNVTPRSLFFLYGFITANEYFPLGAGFGSFGSNMAKIHYSSLYSEYGFGNIYGMGKEESLFLNDNFWPMIMGQYGWIGCMLFLFVVYTLFKIVCTHIHAKNLKIAGFSLFFLLLYSSVGGPIFVHYIGCISVVVFSLVMCVNTKCSCRT